MVSHTSPSFCHEVNVHINKTVEAVTAGLMCCGGGKGCRQRHETGITCLGRAAQPVCKLPGGWRDAAAWARGVQAITSLEKGRREKVIGNRGERVWVVVGNDHGFPLGEEASLQREAQPAEGVVQLEAQVYHDPVKCYFCTYGI